MKRSGLCLLLFRKWRGNPSSPAVFTLSASPPVRGSTVTRNSQPALRRINELRSKFLKSPFAALRAVGSGRANGRDTLSPKGARASVLNSADPGFSTVEVAVVVGITMVLAAVSLPWVRNTVQNYGLSSAVATATGVIQTTRYQAIMKGCAYEVTFNSTNATYQIASELASPCATTFTNVGSALPVATTGGVTLGATTTLQFNPNGTVQATQGALNFNLSNGVSTETITVSGVGDVSVSP